MIQSKSPRVINEGSTEQDVATFFVDNKIYQGFKNIRIARSMTALTGSFDIVLVDKWKIEQQDFELKPGLKIACKIGDVPVYAGYIDSMNISFSADSRNITISGRDKTADLVDCSHVGKNEFNNMKLEAIARELVKPFGIDVILFSETGDPFTKFSITQGDSVFKSLERLAKQRELLLTSSPIGNLVFEKKGIIRSSTELVEGINIQRAAINLDNSERFSRYIVKSQAPGILGDEFDSTQSKGEATDEGIDRYRPTIIINDGQGDSKTAQQRANWEAGLRAAKATTLSVVVIGWTQKGGELWATNQIVFIDCRSLGVKQEMLISKVSFELSERGKICELELIRPDAFEFKIKVKKDKDPLDLLGWEAGK